MEDPSIRPSGNKSRFLQSTKRKRETGGGTRLPKEADKKTDEKPDEKFDLKAIQRLLVAAGPMIASTVVISKINWAYYQSLLDQGFTKSQAIQLVQTTGLRLRG